MNNNYLNEKHEDLYLLADDIPPILNKDHPSVPQIVKNWPYRVSSWPILVSKKYSKQLQNITLQIPELLKKIPHLYFNNDERRIADFYFNSDLAQARASLSDLQNYENSSRLDLVLTETGYKVLEVNFGSTLGGTECQYLDPLMKSLHKDFFDKNDFQTLKFQEEFIRYLDRESKKIRSKTDSLTVFIAVHEEFPVELREQSKTFFEYLVHKSILLDTLEVFVDSLSNLNYRQGLYYEKNHVDSILLLDMTQSLTSDIFKALDNKSILTPDHRGVDIVSDKSNLQILRDLADKGAYEDHENKLIKSCIPWTKRLHESQVQYRDMTVNLLDFIKKNKDKFIIKPNQGFQADEVLIGKYSLQDEWCQIIDNCVTRKHFIVQEYCESIVYYSYNADNKLSTCVPIWGSFCFGGVYGGTMMRISEKDTNKGIVNGQTGLIGLVYEEV